MERTLKHRTISDKYASIKKDLETKTIFDYGIELSMIMVKWIEKKSKLACPSWRNFFFDFLLNVFDSKTINFYYYFGYHYINYVINQQKILLRFRGNNLLAQIIHNSKYYFLINDTKFKIMVNLQDKSIVLINEQFPQALTNIQVTQFAEPEQLQQKHCIKLQIVYKKKTKKTK